MTTQHDYFSTLNYTLSNEDTSFELAVMNENLEHVVSVCGSGARSIALAAKNPAHIDVVDLVKEQLLLANMRLQTHRHLDHEEFLSFWGYGGIRGMNTVKRLNILEKYCHQHNDVQTFGKTLILAANGDPLIYLGRWEKTMLKISRIAHAILGKSNCEALFEATNINDQKILFEKHINPLRLWLFTRAVGNATLFNALLYKGSFPKKNLEVSQSNFYLNSFKHLMGQSIARNNYFLQLIFLGRLTTLEGNPVECHKENFEKIKKSSTEFSFIQRNIIEYTSEKQNIDFVSLSDVPSYFSGDLEKNFLSIIAPSLKRNGIAVLRSYLHIPSADRTQFEDVTEDFTLAKNNEGTAMYRIEVLKRRDDQQRSVA